MKIADVKIGEIYLTKVSGTLVRVVVRHREEPTGFKKQASFRVERADNGKVLQNTRAASALRPVATQDPITWALRAQANVARKFETDGEWGKAAIAWNTLAKDAEAAKRSKVVAVAQYYAENALAKATASEAAK